MADKKRHLVGDNVPTAQVHSVKRVKRHRFKSFKEQVKEVCMYD